MTTPQYLIFLILSYLLGAIPFGVLVARAKGIDIMSVGSGNIGATNVLRILGKGWGLTVFGLDVLKGLAPSLTILLLTHRQEWAFGAGLAAVVGHCLSPFLKFRGGKGVATALGMLLGSVPVAALCAFGVFILLLAITRYVSVASMVAVFSSGLFCLLFHAPVSIAITLFLATVFVIYRHKANIARLREGTESRFTFSPKQSVVEPTHSL